MNFKKFIEELKRRNVIKVATAYAIAGWLIIQIVTSISEPLSLPDWFDTAIILLVFIGFPIALIIAWAFEVTPEGLKKSKEVEITKSVTSDTGKKLNRLIITVLSLAVLFLVINRVFYSQSNSIDKNENKIASIAVLPFADMSPTGDQDYFSDGLSEEILNVLAKVKDMKVAGRTSSFKFKGKNDDLKKMGAELGVAHILEGSVRKSGDQIRVTAQLIKVSDGFHVWSDTYDYNYSAENLFKIQDEISKEVLKELKVKLLGEDAVDEIKAIPTKSTAAYEAYLKGNQLLVNRNPTDIEAAITHFKKSIAFDDKFALAYARLAIAYSFLSSYGNIDKELGLNQIRENADQALLLDNSLGTAWAALGLYYGGKLDRKKYSEALKKAYELEPNNPEITMWYAGSILFNENPILRTELYNRAYELDPLAPIIMYGQTDSYYENQDYKKAEDLSKKNIRLNPEYVNAKSQLINLYYDHPYGQLDDAFIRAYKAHKEHPDNLQILSLLSYIASDLELYFISDQVEEKLNALYPDNRVTAGVHFSNQLNKKEVSEVYKTDFDEFLDKFGLVEGNEFRISVEMNRCLYIKDYNRGIAYIEKYHPIYLSDTLTADPYKENLALAYTSLIFKKAGREAISNRLVNLYCKETEAKFEHNGDITKENIQTVFMQAKCAALKGDAKKTSEIINEFHFNRKSKANIKWFIDEDPIHRLIQDSPEFREVRARIAADIKPMRDNAIAFLKAEGAWIEEIRK